MGTATTLHVQLNLSMKTETELLDLTTSIMTMAPKSQMYSNQSIAAGVSGIGDKVKAFKASRDGVTQAKKTLATARTTRDICREALVSEVNAFAGVAENVAKIPSDLTDLALTLRGPVVIATLAPEVPQSVSTKLPKRARGYATVSVDEPTGTRGSYNAECCADPIVGTGTWSPLAGTGKSRRVTGAPGAKVWVRFQRVRGHQVSDWCTPILVTIP